MNPGALEGILEHIRSSGVPPERIEKFVKLLEKDELLPVIKRVLERCELLEESLEKISEIRGVTDTSREVAHKVEVVRRFIQDSLTDLASDKGYMRSFFRKKSKAKKLKKVLESAEEELGETEDNLVETVRGILLKTLGSIGFSDRELRSKVESIKTIRDLNVVKEIWARIKPELENTVEGGKAVERKEEAAMITEDLLNGILETLARMEDNRKELELRGCTFLLLNEISSLKDHILEWLSGNFGREATGAGKILTLLGRLSEDSEILLATSKRLLKLRFELESLKRNVLEEVSRKMPHLTETISMVGLSSPRLPCTVSTPEEIANLRYEVSKLSSIINALRDLATELHNFTGEIKFQPENLPYRTEEDFLRGLVEGLRSYRLSRDLPSTAYTLPGLMDELLSLYPRWRDYVKEQLEEKGYLGIEELSFIPEAWRDWFLSNLEEEGLIKISEREGEVKVLPKAPTSELGKIRMKLEFLKDTYEDMKPLFIKAGIDSGYIKSLEEKVEQLTNPDLEDERREELTREVNEGLERALDVLRGGGISNEKDEASGDGTPSSWEIHLDS